MNHEPVTWFEQDPDMKSVWYQCDKDAPNAIPLYTHPAKELHLSLQKTEDGELVAVTYTDDEHRIVEVLWEKPPAKTLTDDPLVNFKPVWQEKSELTLTDEEILIEAKYQPNLGYYLACEYDVLDFARAILRKAQEK